VLRKFGIIAVLSLIVAAIAAVPAIAANPHFVGGDPTFTDNGDTITATGSVAGLGNQNVRVVLTADGTAEVVCRNPAGNRAPGQDTEVEASGSQLITRVENGRVNFNVTTVAPEDPTPQEAGCPNRRWTANITNVDFTSATLEIFQPPNADVAVLTETFTF
jgi:hypothetical protein